MRGWLLAPAKTLRDGGPDFQIAALQVAVAFLEPYEVFRSGQDSDRKSKVFFCRAFQRIFGDSQPPQPPEVWDHVAKEFYKQVRCGLFHSAMPGGKVFLSSAVQGIRVDLDATTKVVQQILLNPSYFLNAVESELNSYLAVLRDPNHADYHTCAPAFEAAWHLVHTK